ncbi:hypothetical protein Micbo1qcDRAFT_163424, partial [Microdochium bolleyi]
MEMSAPRWCSLPDRAPGRHTRTTKGAPAETGETGRCCGTRHAVLPVVCVYMSLAFDWRAWNTVRGSRLANLLESVRGLRRGNV